MDLPYIQEIVASFPAFPGSGRVPPPCSAAEKSCPSPHTQRRCEAKGLPPSLVSFSAHSGREHKASAAETEAQAPGCR